MRNTALNQLAYTGIVRLSQCTNGKKIPIFTAKNSGTNPLFDFLYSCLAGDFDLAKTQRPNKIMLLNHQVDTTNNNTKDIYDSLSPFIYQQSKPEVKTDNEPSVIFSFIIPSALLKEGFNMIGLYSDQATESDKFSASIEVTEGISSSFSNTSVFVLDWQLIIQNANT